MRFVSRRICLVAGLVALTIAVSTGLSVTSRGSPSFGDREGTPLPASGQTITEGEFWGLRIGAGKAEAVARLRTLGVHALLPLIREQVVVARAEDLPLLANSPAIIWFPGFVRIRFSGNSVAERDVDPRLPYDWTPRLRGAQTRQEVFQVLIEILEKDEHAEIGNDVPGSKWIIVDNATAQDRELLDASDAWEFNHDNADGFWHVRMEFESEVLTTIVVKHSLTELP